MVFTRPQKRNRLEFFFSCGEILKEGNDEDEEISCTPALAPSRLAQNIPSCQPVDPVRKEMESEDLVDDFDSKVDDATESDHKMEEDNLMDVDNGNESEEVLRKSAGVTAVVDPLLSRSFLNSLYDVDFEESQPAEMKVGLLNVINNLHVHCQTNNLRNKEILIFNYVHKKKQESSQNRRFIKKPTLEEFNKGYKVVPPHRNYKNIDKKLC